MKRYWKQPLFIIGFLILFSLLAGSFAFEAINGNNSRQTFYIEENGRVVEGWPISPRIQTPVHILGTDQSGYDLFEKMLIGVKYTIIAAMAVAAIRMLIAVPIGLIIGTYFNRHRQLFTSMTDPLHYLPMTIFAIFILRPILWEPINGFTTTMWERIILEIVILALLTVPIVISLVANESGILYKQEYVLASKTLGAGNGRIMFKHILPLMREKLFIIYGQQLVETLIIFTHLGVMKLFLGGTDVAWGDMESPPKSISYEWAGLIGDNFRFLMGAPWLTLSPAVGFAIVIFAVSAMMEGFLRASDNHYKKPKKRKGISSIPDEVIEWNQAQLREKMTLLKAGQK